MKKRCTSWRLRFTAPDNETEEEDEDETDEDVTLQTPPVAPTEKPKKPKKRSIPTHIRRLDVTSIGGASGCNMLEFQRRYFSARARHCFKVT